MKSESLVYGGMLVLLCLIFITGSTGTSYVMNDKINTVLQDANKQDITTNNPLPVSLKDQSGNTNFIGIFGEQLSSEQYNDVSVQFQYNLNTDYDLQTPILNGDGSVTVSNSLLNVSSGTGNASISSKNSIRYSPGHTGMIKFTSSFKGSGVGFAGGFDEEDGFFVKVDNGVMSFGYRNDGVDMLTSQANFNGEYNVSNLDYEQINIYMIEFGFLGVANPTLWVFAPDGTGWRVLHTEMTAGIMRDTHVGNPVFPITFESIGDMELLSGSWNAGVLGRTEGVGSRGFIFPNQPLVSGAAAEQGKVTLSGTNVKTLAVFNSKDTFQGKKNKVKAKLDSYDFIVDIPSGVATGGVIFQFIKNPVLNATPTYTDISTNNSVIRYDHAAGTGASVSYVSGGQVVIESVISYVGSSRGGVSGAINIDADKLGAVANAGDTFVIIAKDFGGNNVNVRVVLNWEELF